VHGKKSAISCLALILITFLSLTCAGCGGGQAASVTSLHSAQLSIQPSSVNLSTTSTQQFTITGAPVGAAVSWAVNGVVGGSAATGTISSSGMYQAPAAVPTAAITISATVAGITIGPTATVTVTASTSGPLTISPSTVTVLLPATQQFQVSGAGSGSVTWSVNQVVGGNATVGTISNSGLYTPPLTVPSGLVEIEAKSQSPSSTATAAITLQYPPVTISLIAPAQIPAGTVSEDLTVSGTGFGTFSQVTINGGIVAFGSVTSTQLIVHVPQSDMLFATTLLVNVTNPTPGGGQDALGVQVVGGPPSMTTPRSGHTATLLNNGKVLVAGGSNSSAAGINGLDTAELYDPVSQTFTPTQSTMTTPRTGHTATLLSDGTVLLAGGNNSTAAMSAEIYVPTTDSFHATGNMTTARGAHAAALLLNGKVLIVGGDSVNAVFLTPGTAELFDPSTGAFTATGNTNYFRGGPTATLLLDGTVLVAGGIEDGGIGLIDLNSAELYDPNAGTFTLVGNMTIGRADHTATRLNDGTVLITGGDATHLAEVFSSAQIYTPASRTFVSVGSMAFQRTSHTATLRSTGKVQVIGGTLGATTVTELYDPSQKDFLQSTSLLEDRSKHTATLLPGSAGILVCGGLLSADTQVNPTVTASCEIVP
jgi:Kelch motif